MSNDLDQDYRERVGRCRRTANQIGDMVDSTVRDILKLESDEEIPALFVEIFTRAKGYLIASGVGGDFSRREIAMMLAFALYEQPRHPHELPETLQV